MRYLLLALMVGFLSSCSTSLRPFTDDTFDNNDWNIDELKSVQFYLSDDIVLWREAGSSEKRVENGKIKLVNGRRVEEVIFKEGTPGAYLFSPKHGQFAIGFERDDDKYLIFGPSPKAGGRYVLLAKEWGRRYGKITYDGVVWNTSSHSAYANLLVDMSSRRRTKVKRKEAEGRRVD